MSDIASTLSMITDQIEAGLLDNGVMLDEQDRALVFNVVGPYLHRAESRATREAQLADALAPFARHNGVCDIYRGKPCDCGRDAAVAQHAAARKGTP